MKILKYLVILIGICVAVTFCSNVFPVNADGITKEQAYEMAQIGDMKAALNREIDPYKTIVKKENVQAIIDQIGGIVERYGYGKKEYQIAGYKEGYLFYFKLAIKLKHSPRVYEAKAMYVWEDPIQAEDIKWLNSYKFLRLMAPEQEAEDKVVLYIVKEINTQIPTETILTTETIEATGNKIVRIIEKAGYSKEEYSIRTLFCPAGHIHYKITIESKTRPGQYGLDAKYFFKMIEPKRPIKQKTT